MSRFCKKTKEKTGYSDDDVCIRYIFEEIDGEILDTQVVVSDYNSYVTICTIAGSDKEKFNKEIIDLINKYKI
jgi:hypothetical protein